MSELRWVHTPTTWAVEVRGLAKRFRSVQAVSGLDLHVPVGGVHGLLGPNGSGKTTTLRMLLGLIRPDAGHIQIFGYDIPKQLPDVIDRVGAIVESPKFTPTMTLRHNLELLAISIGAPKSRVTEVLLEVGLLARAEAKFASCSLGMKQRLAIAATLLKRPELLIFDEPTNGLDPAGIHELRDTLQALAQAGRTVVVSSHLLGEIEQVATSLSIIGRGRIIAEGPLDQFLMSAEPHVIVEVADLPLAREVLRLAGYQCTQLGHRLQVKSVGQISSAEVARVLGQNDLWPSHLSLEHDSLESVFLELTQGEHLAATQGRWGQ